MLLLELKKKAWLVVVWTSKIRIKEKKNSQPVAIKDERIDSGLMFPLISLAVVITIIIVVKVR